MNDLHRVRVGDMDVDWLAKRIRLHAVRCMDSKIRVRDFRTLINVWCQYCFVQSITGFQDNLSHLHCQSRLADLA